MHYEADAQLAYLQRNGLIDGVLTLDGDLFLYGATEVVLDYNLDNGTGQLYDLKEEAKGTGSKRPDPYFNQLFMAVVKWGPCVMQIYAALVGCDYFEKRGVHGIGPDTADKIFDKLGARGAALAANTLPQLTAIRHAIENVLHWDEVRLSAAMEHVEQVLNVYQHQVIYDPRTKTNRPLSHAASDIVSADSDPPAYCGYLNRFASSLVECCVRTHADEPAGPAPANVSDMAAEPMAAPVPVTTNTSHEGFFDPDLFVCTYGHGCCLYVCMCLRLPYGC